MELETWNSKRYLCNCIKTNQYNKFYNYFDDVNSPAETENWIKTKEIATYVTLFLAALNLYCIDGPGNGFCNIGLGSELSVFGC